MSAVWRAKASDGQGAASEMFEFEVIYVHQDAGMDGVRVLITRAES